MKMSLVILCLLILVSISAVAIHSFLVNEFYYPENPFRAEGVDMTIRGSLDGYAMIVTYYIPRHSYLRRRSWRDKMTDTYVREGDGFNFELKRRVLLETHYPFFEGKPKYVHRHLVNEYSPRSRYVDFGADSQPTN